MNNYDDLKRFREKTQTLDIDFKDMSAQSLDAGETSKWALIRQLAKEEDTTASRAQAGHDQPQLMRSNEFLASASEMAPAPTAAQAHAPRPSLLNTLNAIPAVQSEATPDASVASLFPFTPAEAPVQAAQPVPSATASRMSLLDTLNASMSEQPAAPAEVSSPVSTGFPFTPAESVAQEPVTTPAPAMVQSAPAALQAAPATVPAFLKPQPVVAPGVNEPGRFGNLFRARHSEPVTPSKETLLKSLLEKIALCR